MNRKILTIALLSILVSTADQTLAADAEKGKSLFATLCASCHGATGAGDGAAASAFPADQKPRNFTTETFKFATDQAKFSDLMKKGGMGVGLSMLMPAQPSLSDEDIANIYAYVNSIKKK